MKAFFVSALALLVSAATASLVPRQTGSQPFIITAVDSDFPEVNGRNAYVSFHNGRVYLGPAPDVGAVNLIVAKYKSEDETIENAFDPRQKLWIAFDKSRAVYLHAGPPSLRAHDRPYLISPDGEIASGESRFPYGWTACPARDGSGAYELFYQYFGGDCTAVKLVKSQVPDN